MRRSECREELVEYTSTLNNGSYIVPGLGDFGDRFYTL